MKEHEIIHLAICRLESMRDELCIFCSKEYYILPELKRRVAKLEDIKKQLDELTEKYQELTRAK